MNFETVIYNLSDEVAEITFNRPEALNALSLTLTKELKEAIEKATGEQARAVVLSGAGRAFCSGGDLREMQQIAGQTGNISAFFEEPLEALHAVIQLIRETPIPFIAAVGGVCAGAGTNVALACDLVFASENAVFNEAFIKIGLSPDCGGSFFLPRVIGEKRAAELFMTGDALTAQKALEMGMINRVVALENLAAESQQMAKRLAKMPTSTIGRIKRMLNASFSNNLVSQLALEHECQIQSGQSNDFREGVKAFFEKREAQFQGN